MIQPDRMIPAITAKIGVAIRVVTQALRFITSPADIGYDAKRNRVLIPLFIENRVEIRQVK